MARVPGRCWPAFGQTGILAKMSLDCLNCTHLWNPPAMSLLTHASRCLSPNTPSSKGQPRPFQSPLALLFAVTAVAVFAVGCGPSATMQEGGTAAEDHDHEHHDHEHDDHDHADHDHEGHDHAAGDNAHGDDDHQHPETMAEAVEMLKGLVASVKSTLGGDDASEADGHVHAVGHLLNDMEAKAEELEEDVRDAVADLIKAFGELDEKIHDEAEPVFDEIAERVEAAITALESHVEQVKKTAGGAAEDAPKDGDATDETNGTDGR
jgi:uncharacterized protein YoxC